MCKEVTTRIETEGPGGCFMKLPVENKRTTVLWDLGREALVFSEEWRGLEEIVGSRILSLNISNDWFNLGIKWANKHLKCSEFNQM